MKDLIRKEILKNVSSYFPNNKKEHPVLEISKIKFAGSSEVFKCKISDNNSSNPLFFKKTIYPNGEEFKTLKYVSTLYSPSDNYRVPFPISYVDEENILATEFISGKSANRLINRYMLIGISFLNRQNLSALANKIVNWLLVFEERTKSDSKISYDLVDLNSKIELMNLENKFKDAMTSYVHSFGKEKIVLPSHLINDGFHTSNMIVRNEGLILVDWGCSYQAPIFTMLCSFLRKLEQKSRYFVISDRSMNYFISSIIEGYKKKTIYSDYLKYFGVVYLGIIVNAIDQASVYINSSSRHRRIMNKLFIHRYMTLATDSTGF